MHAMPKSTSTSTQPMLPMTLPRTLKSCAALPSPSSSTDPQIFIASYPKSGTTWLQACLYELVTKGLKELDHISNYCPFLENDKTWLYEEEEGGGELEGEGKINSKARQSHQSIGAELYNTHLWYESMPLSNPLAKYIYVHRPARDACASFYHHLTHMTAVEGGVKENVGKFVDDWCSGAVAFGGWADHLNSWIGKEGKGKDERVLVVEYEEMKKDLPEVLRKIVAHCGLSVTDEEIANLLPKLSLQYMKANCSKYEPKSVEWIEKGDGFQFIRNGEGAKAKKGSLFSDADELKFCRYLSNNLVPI